MRRALPLAHVAQALAIHAARHPGAAGSQAVAELARDAGRPLRVPEDVERRARLERQYDRGFWWEK